MRYFTRNPLERMMMQVPRPQREQEAPAAPKGHRCYGCGRYGEPCILPCYRDRMPEKTDAKNRDL